MQEAASYIRQILILVGFHVVLFQPVELSFSIIFFQIADQHY